VSTPPSRTAKRQRQKEGAQARRAAELAALRKQQRNRRIIRFVIFGGIAAAIVFAMSIFGGNDNKSDKSASKTTTTTAATAESSTTVATTPVTPPTCTAPDGTNTDLTKKPTVTAPPAPATELSCRDLVVGSGKDVKPGDTVTVQYVGVAQSNGKQFDSTWDKGGEPISFSLDEVIPGWTNGIPGMKVGGRRELTIPGEMAYGPSGRPPDIGPNDTLVFVVDVTDTKSA